MKKTILALLAWGLFGFTAASASASTFTINYTGTIAFGLDVPTFTPDFADPLVGSAITGSLTFLNGVTVGDTTIFDQVDGSLALGSGPTTTASFTEGKIAITNGSPTSVFITVGPQNIVNPAPAPGAPLLLSFLDLAIVGTPSTPLSLANFPTDNVAALAYFGSAMEGLILPPSGSGLGFNVTSFTASYSAATTPIPAAIWLFLSALGGLAWAARRQRRGVVAPAIPAPA